MSVITRLKLLIAPARSREDLREGAGLDTDEAEPSSGMHDRLPVYECRVCGHRSFDPDYCPECLANTMRRVPAAARGR